MSTLADVEKQLITNTLIKFQRGQLTIQEAATRLLAEIKQAEVRKTKSDRRLKSLCGALRRERSAAKVRELKRALREEFYSGDRAS